MIEKYGFNHISTGDVLRSEIKNGTELGKTAKGFIDNGQLIPDELMIDILASVYDSFGKEHKGVIFDGFPRTIPQAEALKKMLAERGHKVAAMIELDVPEDELMKRLVRYLRVNDPTGEKVELGTAEGDRGSYDFSDDMRNLQWGVMAGADWHFHKSWGVFADLSWGFTGVFKKSFHVIDQTMYPVYGTIGVTYRMK